MNTDELDIWCRIAQQRGGLDERNATVTAARAANKWLTNDNIAAWLASWETNQ